MRFCVYEFSSFSRGLTSSSSSEMCRVRAGGMCSEKGLLTAQAPPAICAILLAILLG